MAQHTLLTFWLVITVIFLGRSHQCLAQRHVSLQKVLRPPGDVNNQKEAMGEYPNLPYHGQQDYGLERSSDMNYSDPDDESDYRGEDVTLEDGLQVRGLVSGLQRLSGERDAFNKRAPALSLNQDLASLAGLVQRQRVDSARSFLNSLGKRSGVPAKRMPSLSVGQEMMSLAEMINSQTDRDSSLNALHALGKRLFPGNNPLRMPERRSQLSVGIPLSTISDMMEANRRRRQSMNAESHLSALGK